MADTARQRARLLAALRDALEGMEGMIIYMEPRWAWEHQRYIDRAKAVLEEFEEE